MGVFFIFLTLSFLLLVGILIASTWKCGKSLCFSDVFFTLKSKGHKVILYQVLFIIGAVFLLVPMLEVTPNLWYAQILAFISGISLILTAFVPFIFARTSKVPKIVGSIFLASSIFWLAFASSWSWIPLHIAIACFVIAHIKDPVYKFLWAEIFILLALFSTVFFILI